MAPRLLFVDNDINTFVGYRLGLAIAARNRGFEVHVTAPPGKGEATVAQAGLHYHRLPITRKGKNFATEVRTIVTLYRLYRDLRPDLVHHLRLKPILYGGIAARLARVPAQVSLLTGLGHIFTARTPDARFMSFCTLAGCRFAFGHPNAKVVFQNPDDRALFLNRKALPMSKAELIRGSGVDTDLFIPVEEHGEIPIVLLGARMLRSKGIEDFVAAARMLRADGVAARFVLVGDVDDGNPTAISREQVEAWQEAGLVEWWGRREDMVSILAESSIVCLPSLREGVPKILIEAASAGRAIVTTDVPGCREIVRHGYNGFLVPPKDAHQLAKALCLLIENPQLRKRFGGNGRELVKAEFSLKRVISENFDIYDALLESADTESAFNGSAITKRTLDIVVSSIALLLVSPVFLILLLLVKLTSRGPALYKGLRVGRHGRDFQVLKFRSMVIDAERLGGSATASDDPRITPCGALLRRTKLDEIPQLINVLRGDMSLVGPRPEVRKYVDMYTATERKLLRLRPGITDWASIWNCNEGEVLDGSPDPERTYEDLIRPTKLALQLMYLRQASFITDVKILFSTALRLFFPGWTPRELKAFDNVMTYKMTVEHSTQQRLSIKNSQPFHSETEKPMPTLDSPIPAISGGTPAFQQPFRFIVPALPPLAEVVAQYERSYNERLVTNGDCVARFEAAVAERLGVMHCVAVSSCTSGLTLLMRALDLSGEVIIPSFTFFATGHAARWNGLTPVFADIDPETWTISLPDVERKITRATSAIVGVHLYGNPSDVDGLQKLAERHRLSLIFDAAHAFGSATQTRPIGQFGDAEVFSLSPTKLLVAGEGGLITTNNSELAKDLRALRNYGDAGNYDPARLGANARMSEFNAALGLSGLPLVDEKVKRRQYIAARYTELLSEVPGCMFQHVREGDCHTYKDYSVKIDPVAFGMNIDELRKALLEENIETRRYFYPPLHLQKLYSRFFRSGIDGLSVAEDVASNILSLPIYEALPDRTVDLVASAIRRLQLHQKRVPLTSASEVGHVSAAIA